MDEEERWGEVDDDVKKRVKVNASSRGLALGE